MLVGTDGGDVAVCDTQRGGPSSNSGLLFTVQCTADDDDVAVRALAWYPTDTGVFFSAAGNKLTVWDTNAAAAAASAAFEGVLCDIAPVVAGTTPLVAVAGHMPDCVRLYDVRVGAALTALSGHNGAAQCVRWEPGSEHVLWSAGPEGNLVAWDVRVARPLHTQRYEWRRGTAPHCCSVVHLCFSTDGSALYTADTRGMLKRWAVDTATHSLTDTGVVYPVHHSGTSRPVRFAVSTDNTRVYVPAAAAIDIADADTFVVVAQSARYLVPLWHTVPRTNRGRRVAVLKDMVQQVVECQFDHCTNVCCVCNDKKHNSTTHDGPHSNLWRRNKTAWWCTTGAQKTFVPPQQRPTGSSRRRSAWLWQVSWPCRSAARHQTRPDLFNHQHTNSAMRSINLPHTDSH